MDYFIVFILGFLAGAYVARVYIKTQAADTKHFWWLGARYKVEKTDVRRP